MKQGILGVAAAFGFWLMTLLAAAPALAADGGIEIKGEVQAAPASGLLGAWTIAGTSVLVDEGTAVDQEHGPLVVGALVEVKGVSPGDGQVLATSIEVEGDESTSPGDDSGHDADDDSEDDGTDDSGHDGADDSGHDGIGDPDDEPGFTGVVTGLPESGLLGIWDVGGRQVLVVSTTRLEQAHGAFAVGAIVEIEGLVDAQTGVIVASEIEVKLGAGGLSGGDGLPIPAEVELHGRIESLPSDGLIGTWTVAGREVFVTAETLLDDEHGPFAVGVGVEVKAALDATGGLIAAKVEREAGNGAPVPALEFWGSLVELPAGLVGVWKVDDKLVNVTPATRIEADDAPLAVGVIVEVSGWPQSDGMIEAREIETRVALGQTPGQGSEAVEYFNARLGHFFVTANPEEIAMLDAGAFDGQWRRTGQTFNVGGGKSGVCRFYGMPPKGPDSHFFTADPAECQKVMEDYQAWTFEGHAFSTTAPVGGQCPVGTIAVQRFYNSPAAGSEMNHRFTVTQEAFDETLAMGWIPEGVVMCAAF